MEEKEAAREIAARKLRKYQKTADFLLNFQVLKAYWKDSNASVLFCTERVLCERFRKEWEKKIIRKEFYKLRGERNARGVISIPQLKIEDTCQNVLNTFVYENFSTIIKDMERGYPYPPKF